MKSKITITVSMLLISISSFATQFNIGFGGSIGLAYSPNVVHVTVGDTVNWMGSFDNHPLASTSVPSGATAFSYGGPNSTFSYVVPVAGTYNFQCSIHLFTGQIIADAGTGINENRIQNEISIYPTSTHNFLKINLPSTSKNLFVEVKNIVGQTAMKSQLASGIENTLDLSNLYNGIYFIAIRNDMDVVKVVRIVKE
ncbi:MAG: T9SS type A sorting domain-containing protein [Bacteroidota bacterium]